MLHGIAVFYCGNRMGGGAWESGQRTDALPSYIGTKAKAFEQTR